MANKFVFFASQASAQGEAVNWKDAKTIYEFSAKDIDGNDVSLEKYRWVINVPGASHWNIWVASFVDQY